jgi:hypothetical protein
MWEGRHSKIWTRYWQNQTMMAAVVLAKLILSAKQERIHQTKDKISLSFSRVNSRRNRPQAWFITSKFYICKKCNAFSFFRNKNNWPRWTNLKFKWWKKFFKKFKTINRTATLRPRNSREQILLLCRKDSIRQISNLAAW